MYPLTIKHSQGTSVCFPSRFMPFEHTIWVGRSIWPCYLDVWVGCFGGICGETTFSTRRHVGFLFPPFLVLNCETSRISRRRRSWLFLFPEICFHRFGRCVFAVHQKWFISQKVQKSAIFRSILDLVDRDFLLKMQCHPGGAGQHPG